MLIIIEGCSSESQRERAAGKEGQQLINTKSCTAKSIENMKRVWSQITKTQKATKEGVEKEMPHVSGHTAACGRVAAVRHCVASQ